MATLSTHGTKSSLHSRLQRLQDADFAPSCSPSCLESSFDNSNIVSINKQVVAQAQARASTEQVATSDEQNQSAHLGSSTLTQKKIDRQSRLKEKYLRKRAHAAGTAVSEQCVWTPPADLVSDVCLRSANSAASRDLAGMVPP